MPQDLTEAARMDGANLRQLFRHVHVPLARPAKRTMAGALGAFQGQWGTDIPLLCAGSLLILGPTLLVFLVFQRQFVSALLAGAVKA
jgi:raffinose/stachyose/melibiose transport system permease protein